MASLRLLSQPQRWPPGSTANGGCVSIEGEKAAAHRLQERRKKWILIRHFNETTVLHERMCWALYYL